jgi:hypothetical protein
MFAGKLDNLQNDMLPILESRCKKLYISPSLILTVRIVRTVYLCVPYGSRNKQGLFL